MRMSDWSSDVCSSDLACSCESRNQESRATLPATLGSCFRRSTGSFLQIDQNPRRILDRVLERDEEGHRLAAVDQAVVVSERELHHRTDPDQIGNESCRGRWYQYL